MGIEAQSTGQRNSEYRKLSERFLDVPVRKFHELFPKVTADQVSGLGVVLSVAGIHLMESQKRAGKYNPHKVLLAGILLGLGWSMDLFDGKVARERRKELATEKERYEDEKIGQVKDPLFDSVIETAQCLESAYTSHKLGNRFGVATALWNLATCNVPRTFKAVAGIVNKSVPEAYRPYDPRFFGTSLGRKIPLSIATFFPEVASYANLVGGVANTVVGVERARTASDGFDRAFDPNKKAELSNKEIDFALPRAGYLGVQSLVNLGVALVAGSLLKSK